jgi:hypothetical protein
MSEKSQCTIPPALSEEQLSLALDGLAELSIEQHLEACTYCRLHLRQLEAFDTALRAPLYRFDCPDASEISHYHLNLFLNEAERERIALHLEKCSLCQSELSTLESFLEEDTLSDAKFLQPDFQRSTANSKVILFPKRLAAPKRAVRGTGTSAILARAGTTTIRLQIKHSETESSSLNIQAISADVDWKDAIVVLFQDGELQSLQMINQYGSCDCKLSTLTPITLQLIAQDKTFIEFKDVEVET